MPLNLRRRGFFVGLGLGAYLLFLLLRARPEPLILELASAPGRWASGVLGELSSLAPFPVAELLLVLLLGRWGGMFARDLRRAHREGCGGRGPLLAGGGRVAGDVGFLVFLFYLLWGFGYAGPSLDERMSLDPSPLQVEELTALAEEMVRATNEEYLRIHGSSDGGEPTARPNGWEAQRSALDVGWRRFNQEAGLELRDRSPSPKPLWLGAPIRRLGISGIYVPFTGEALILPDLPAASFGLTLAHETAHQRGITDEGDANFAGFVVASRSEEPHLRYAAFLFAQRQLLAALARTDREAYRRLVEARFPGVRRDLEDLQRYWSQVDGLASEMGQRMNDAYLRGQGIPDGIRSYSRSTGSLVRYARTRGGTLLPDDPVFRADGRDGSRAPAQTSDPTGVGER